MEVFKVLNFIAISQIIVFILIIANRKQLRKENKVFLIIYLVTILICILDRVQYYYHNELNQINFPHFYHSADPFYYLYLPALFLYIKSVTQSSFRLRWIQLIHLIPFIVVLANLLINYSFQSVEVKYQALNYETKIYIPPYKSELASSILFFQYAYILVGFYHVYKYQHRMKKSVSTIYWYYTTPLYIALSSFILLLLVRIIIIELCGMNFPIDIDLIFFSVIIIFLAYYQKELFINPPVQVNKDKIYSLDVNASQQIKEFMEKGEVYLDPDITLNILANKMNLAPRKLSQILNKNLNENFYTFVNKYRINHAAEMLANPKYSDKTVLEILYEVGFNNKSAFNRFFKQFINQTPTEYRRIHQTENSNK